METEQCSRDEAEPGPLCSLHLSSQLPGTTAFSSCSHIHLFTAAVCAVLLSIRLLSGYGTWYPGRNLTRTQPAAKFCVTWATQPTTAISLLPPPWFNPRLISWIFIPRDCCHTCWLLSSSPCSSSPAILLRTFSLCMGCVCVCVCTQSWGNKNCH